MTYTQETGDAQNDISGDSAINDISGDPAILDISGDPAILDTRSMSAAQKWKFLKIGTLFLLSVALSGVLSLLLKLVLLKVLVISLVIAIPLVFFSKFHLLFEGVEP